MVPRYRPGMGPALNTAAGMNAYILADRGTWLSFKNRGDLAIVVEGDKRLFNQYGIMLVNPQKHPQREGRTRPGASSTGSCRPTGRTRLQTTRSAGNSSSSPTRNDDQAIPRTDPARARQRVRQPSGPGKAELIERIDAGGSISAAARAMGCPIAAPGSSSSALESLPVASRSVTTAIGGRRGGGAQVTEFGRRLVRLFRAMEGKGFLRRSPRT